MMRDVEFLIYTRFHENLEISSLKIGKIEYLLHAEWTPRPARESLSYFGERPIRTCCGPLCKAGVERCSTGTREVTRASNAERLARC